MKTALCVPALLLLVLLHPAEAAPRVRLAGVSVGVGYSHFSGPYWGTWYDPWYGDRWFYNPFFYPGYLTGFSRGPGMGEVKLRSDVRDAEVFLDGAYAGTMKDLKSMWLEPGAYNLEVRASNASPYARRIYVLSGRTLRLDARPPEATK